MAGLFSRIAAFARTPAGQKAIRTAGQKAQELAKDPKNRDKVEQLRRRVSGGSSPHDGTTGTTGTTGGPGSDVPPTSPR